MQKFKEKFSDLLLFAIGTGWGYLWTMEILACPEWWFIGLTALLTGAGISLTRFMPGAWRQVGPALCFCVILLLEPSELRSVLLPLMFGLWYGGNQNIISNWRISRIFCGGLVIGGILTGIFPEKDLFCAPALTVLMLIYGGLHFSWFTVLEMALISTFYLWCFTRDLPQNHRRWIDTGTVMSAFGLIAADEKSPEKLPKIVFVGGNSEDHLRCARELSMVSDLLFLPELPGSVPPGADMIIVCGLPDNVSGVSSLYRSLHHRGILVMPRQYCQQLPQLQWHILPGSDGDFAAASPAGNLNLDPELMDRQINGHFRKVPDRAPVRGALSGILIDFKDQTLEIRPPESKNLFHIVLYGLAAFLTLVLMWLSRARSHSPETAGILLNCAGYTILCALLIPAALLAMPTLLNANSIITPAINSLIIISAVMWIFRRPVRHDRQTRHAGLISLLALGASWFGYWIAALISLVCGGFAFAGLDGDFCSDRDAESEPVRFLGFAAGAFAVSIIQQTPWSFPALFITAAAMRLWTWLRN